jgi:hypothetical protein
MKGFKVAEARARFGELLDEAEKGETVFIERYGTWFALKAEGPPAKSLGRKVPKSTITWAHPAVEAGQWTWREGPNGSEFVDTRRRKSRR